MKHRQKLAVLIATVLFALVLIDSVNAGRGGGGSRSSGGGSRSRGGGYGGSSHSSGGGFRHTVSSASRPKPKPQAPQPRPQPNHDSTKLSYGHNEPTHTQTNTKPHESKPAPKPNEEHTKLTYGNSENRAPPVQQATNQQSHAPSAPPAPGFNVAGAGNPHAPSAPPAAGFNVPAGGNPHAPSAPPAPGFNVGGNPAQQQHVSQQHSGNPHSPSAPPAPGFNVGGSNTNPVGNPGAAPAIGWNVAGGAKPGQQPHGGQPTGTAGSHPDTFNKQHVAGQQNTQYGGGVGGQQYVHPNQNGYQPNQGGGYHPYPQQQYNNYNGNGYHPGYGAGGGYGSGGYGGYGGYNGGGGYHPAPGYNPPGTNIHYGPVTYINGHPSPPSYHYYHDTSDHSLLSLYIGYKIGQMFSYNSYGHSSPGVQNTYVFHHYHEDKKSTVPEKITVQGDTIVGCNENNTLICISNTLPVCLSNGTIFCVTAPQQTVPCKQDAKLQCVDSVINCTTNAADPACNGTSSTSSNQTTLSIPCISSVSISGDLSANLTQINATSITIPAQNIASTLTENRVLCVTVIAVPTVSNNTVANGTDINWEKVAANNTMLLSNGTSPLVGRHPHEIASDFLKKFILHLWST